MKHLLTYILLFSAFAFQSFGQDTYTPIEKEIKDLSFRIDTLTQGEYGRSAFLDRGLDIDILDVYDSLQTVFRQKFEAYLKMPISIKNAKSIIGNWIDVKEIEGMRIFQWEYITGGTQEEVLQYVQTYVNDSIQISFNTSYWTYELISFEGNILLFESHKGCTTCCEERIIFNGLEIYNIQYKNDYIKKLFLFDSNNNTIQIILDNLFIEGSSDDDYTILNKTIALEFNGKEFIELK